MLKFGHRSKPGIGTHSKVARLPWHRRDPFDRLLIAQASVENLPIVSVDEAFDDYAVTRLW